MKKTERPITPVSNDLSKPNAGRVLAPADATPEQLELFQDIGEFVNDLMNYAARKGVIVTIERVPGKPLAMGNHAPVASLRMARG